MLGGWFINLLDYIETGKEGMMLYMHNLTHYFPSEAIIHQPLSCKEDKVHLASS